MLFLLLLTQCYWSHSLRSVPPIHFSTSEDDLYPHIRSPIPTLPVDHKILSYETYFHGLPYLAFFK